MSKQIVKIFFLLVVFLSAPNFVRAAASPVILFSDLTDGPVSGWEGSATKGVAVSIWGRNLGSTRGSSFVTVGGVNLTSDSDYAEWGATTNPQTANGQQRITFWLNSAMLTSGTAPNTTIKITIDGVVSNVVPFHCRALGSNHIYFLSPTGSDSNAGTLASPWLSGKKLRQVMVAGDTAYLRQGIYTSLDDAAGANRATWIEIYQSNIANGTQHKSVSVSSYPGEEAQVGNGDLYSSTNQIPEKLIDRVASTLTGTVWNYWTFSKLKVRVSYAVIIEGTSSNTNGDRGLRFIGNDIRTTAAAYSTGAPFTKEGGGLGSEDFYLLGNYFNHVGVPLPPTTRASISVGAGSGLTGTYNAKYTYAKYSSVGTVFAVNTPYALNGTVTPTAFNGYYYKVVSTGAAGTSGGTEPVWPTTAFATVNTGSVIFTAYPIAVLQESEMSEASDLIKRSFASVVESTDANETNYEH
jgi:hypothetical protein